MQKKHCLTIGTSKLRGDDVPLHDIKLIVIVAEASSAGSDQDVQRNVTAADDAHGLFDESDGGSDTCSYVCALEMVDTATQRTILSIHSCAENCMPNERIVYEAYLPPDDLCIVQQSCIHQTQHYV